MPNKGKGDFGHSQKCNEFETLNKLRLGTCGFSAPETWVYQYAQKSDIWSLGITLRELAGEHLPFYHLKGSERWKKIYELGVPAPHIDKRKWSPDFVAILESCFQMKLHDRPTAKELLSHAFFDLTCTSEEFHFLGLRT